MASPWLAGPAPIRVGGMAPPGRVARRVAFAVLVVLVVLVVGLAGGRGAEPVRANDGAVVAVDQLNLRAEPGTWAEVIVSIWGGEWLAVYAGPTADGWYQVGYGGLTGWVYGAHLTIGGAPGWGEAAWSEPAPEPWAPAGETVVASSGVGAAVGGAWVAIDSVNVRAWAGLEADLLGELWYGEPVTVLGGEVNGFVPVAFGGGQAWVWRDYLSLDGPPGPERWVDVDRSSQLVTLYEGEAPVATYWGSMGFDQSADGFFSTALGTYYVYEKYEDLSWTDWGRAWVTDWVGFDPGRLNGFHSFSRDSSGALIPGGDGPTGGCIALAPAAADHLFAFVRIGSRVEVHW
jgi:hypothetical protein